MHTKSRFKVGRKNFQAHIKEEVRNALYSYATSANLHMSDVADASLAYFMAMPIGERNKIIVAHIAARIQNSQEPPLVEAAR